jgi:hypothetical protein
VSISAISWVLKQDISRSSEKFLLTCLANYADDRGLCYPSITTLERDTSQNRKTIIANLKNLQAAGLLRDTAHRVGATRSVVVYQLVGLPDSSAVHYVYRVWNPVTGEYYLGKRSFNGDPEQDTYRGSGKWTRECDAKGIVLLRSVIEAFETNEEALAAEVRLFREADGDPLCKNEQLPSLYRAREMKRRIEERGTKIGTPQAVPFFRESSTVFPEKQSQKRDTEPLIDPLPQPSDKKKGRQIPESFVVTDEMRAWAAENGMRSPDELVDQFRDYHTAKGSIYKDWNATFRTWIRNDKEFRARRTDPMVGSSKRPKSLNDMDYSADLF